MGKLFILSICDMQDPSPYGWCNVWLTFYRLFYDSGRWVWLLLLHPQREKKNPNQHLCNPTLLYII